MRKLKISPLIYYLFIGDIIFVSAGLFLASMMRSTIVFGVGGALPLERVQLPWGVYLTAIICWIGSMAINGVYNPQHVLRWFNETFRVVAAAVIATFILGGFLYFSYRQISRLQVVYSFSCIVLLMLSFRYLIRVYYRIIQREHPGTRHRVVILGAGDLGERVMQMFLNHSRWGFNLVGFLDDDPTKLATAVDGVPILGEIDQLEKIVRKQRVDEVWVALPIRAYERLEQVITRLEALPVRIYVVPDYFSYALVQARAEIFSGLPVIGLRESVIGGVNRQVKRVIDVIISTLLLILLAPLFLVISAAILLSSGRPVFFRQQRVGENLRLFDMFKFRTMVKDAEAQQADLNRVDADGNIFHKSRGDARVTTVGRFLRRFSLDELPQLLNVLLGNMSLVGPRPELPWLVDRYESWQRKRFAVPQGISGWWQINERSDKPMHLNTDYDLYYVYNYSLMLDLIILLRTPLEVIRGRGAF